MNRPALVAAAAIAVIGLLAALAAVGVERYLDSIVTVPEEGAGFEITPGSSFAAVARDLEQQGVIKHAKLLRYYAGFTGQASNIHAGEYHIEPGTTPRGLLDQFTSGNVRLYSFTIIEGWNQHELLTALRDHPQIDVQLSDEDWLSFLADLGSDATHPEGMFLPETYRFPRNTSDKTLLQQAYGLMQSTLSEEWDARDPDAVVDSPYEALILASIVEKETARADERARISGVFSRRLQKRMRLQTDPTVIYGIGPAFNGNLTRRDLQADTAYNTYTRNGLPPTPIAMPGRDAIRAALHPEGGTELYFVATGLGDGSHKFSTTKDEHDAAVAEYLRRLRAKRSK